MFVIGNKPANRRVVAFTLIELILVMAIFVIVMGIAAPELRGFFRGRNLDNEAQRFLSLTRYGRSRAISEGLPVELWVNPKAGSYGLQALSGYTETRTNAIAYAVDSSIQISTSTATAGLTRSNFWTQTRTVTRGLPTIRFQPDGYISDSSPRQIFFKQGGDQEVWLAEGPNHARYELQSGPPPATRP